MLARFTDAVGAVRALGSRTASAAQPHTPAQRGEKHLEAGVLSSSDSYLTQNIPNFIK